MKDKVIAFFIISLIANFVLTICIFAYKADAEKSQEINQDFFELGKSIKEYNRCAKDLETNYKKGSEEYYNSDAFIETAAAKSRMENAKTDILMNYGYQF